MKKLFILLSSMALLGLLVAPGCKKQQEQEAEEPAKVEEAAESPERAEARAVRPEQAAEKAEVDTQAGDTDVPNYIKDMVKHIEAINRLTGSNMNDCTKAMELVGTYIEDNKEEISAFQESAMKSSKSMSVEEQAKFAQQVAGTMVPLAQETAKIQKEFADKCQIEAKRIGEMMSKLQLQGAPQE